MKPDRLSSMDDFRSLVAGKSVVIVGPAPHLEKQNLGGFIDQHDFVVRINSIASQLQAGDYGSRTDILFVGNSDAGLVRELTQAGGACASPKIVVYPKGSSASALKVGTVHFEDSNEIHFLEIDARQEMAKLDNQRWPRLPTTGFLAIVSCIAASPASLHVCGFNFYSSFRTYGAEDKKFKKSLGFRTFTVSGHTVEQEVKYLQNLKYSPEFSSDRVFNKLIIQKKYRGRHPVVHLSQFIRNSLNGLLVKLRLRPKT